jgi:hypothetical protein
MRLLPIVLGIALLAGLPGLAACDDSAAPATAPTATATATASAAPSEDGCARIVSAIGFADFVLLPSGREAEQSFDSAVRGRLAYVEGTVVLFGEYLPADLRDTAETLREAVKRLVAAKTPRAEQVAALKDYRQAAAELLAACGATGSPRS